MGMNQQSSQPPYIEVKVPPPLTCAYSRIASLAQRSHALATSLINHGWLMLSRLTLSFPFALSNKALKSSLHVIQIIKHIMVNKYILQI